MSKILMSFHLISILCLISVESGRIRRPLSTTTIAVQIPNPTTVGYTFDNNSLAKNSMANNGTKNDSQTTATDPLNRNSSGQTSKGSKMYKNMKIQSRSMKFKQKQLSTPDTPELGVLKRTTTTTTRKPNFVQYDQKKIPFLWIIMIAMELFIIITLVCCWGLTSYLQNEDLRKELTADSVSKTALSSVNIKKEVTLPKTTTTTATTSTETEQPPEDAMPAPEPDPLTNIPEEPEKNDNSEELAIDGQTAGKEVKKLPSDSSVASEGGLAASKDLSNEKTLGVDMNQKPPPIVKTEPFKNGKDNQ